VAGERKPMRLDELTAAVLDLSPEDRFALMERVENSMFHDDIDPAVLERARRSMADVKSGHATAVAANEVLDMLDRIAR
jgi:hypothetical protein